MTSLKQTDRLMQFSSPLGKDVLLIESLDGAEGISRLFEFQVELLATVDTAIDPKSIIGSKVTVAITLSDVRGTRWINGIVRSFEQRAGDKEFNMYRARIVPSMWQLGLSANCRIFQNKSVVEIVKSIISGYGLSLSDQTSNSYQQLEYCTQYSETDLHFISRLMEESGIFYWFEHTDQDNKIVLGDGRTAYQDCPLLSSVPYAENARGAEGAYGARVAEFSSTATMVSGKHSTADYTYKTFVRSDTPDKNSSSPFGNNAFDVYLYPAGGEGYADDATQTVSDLESLFLQSRALAADTMAEVFNGDSNARSFCAGYTFSLSHHPNDAWNRKYLLTEVTHRADQIPSYRTTDTKDRSGYTNGFTAVSSDIVFKPAQTILKPRILGPQTAVVVGSSGEEIHIDSLGRIKVRFFWDKKNDRSTDVDATWVRVAQSWAGNGWGTYFWPRVGDEVVIQFLNGDPDNPLIAGSVFNGVNLPKYALPESSTRSGILTRSSKGGSGQNANELRFEDKMGSEQIYLHAEKDMDASIEHDLRRSVGNNDSLIVTNNQSEQIGSNYNREIKSNSVEKIGSNSDISIGSNLTEQVGGNHSENISSNYASQVGSNYSMNAKSNIYLNAGMNVVIQGGAELCIQAGGSFITLGPEGVAISGTMVLINSGGAAVSGQPGTISSSGTPAAPDQAEGATGQSSQTVSGPASPSTPVTPLASGALPSSASSALGSLGSTVPGAAGAAAGKAEQTAQQAANQAEQGAQQAAQQAQQAAQQAQQAAQQAEQQAQQAVNQVKQEAGQAYQQAKQAVQQAQQAVSQASAQGKAAAQQALNQAQQQVQQAGQAGAQAVQQAQQQAQQVQQQAQQAAQQAQQQAQQAAAQAQQAAKQAQQGAQQAAQQAQQQAQQAAAQAQQAAKQAEQQAQQAQQQVQQAASQAQQQAQQASQAAQQSANQAMNQAKQGF